MTSAPRPTRSAQSPQRRISSDWATVGVDLVALVVEPGDEPVGRVVDAPRRALEQVHADLGAPCPGAGLIPLTRESLDLLVEVLPQVVQVHVSRPRPARAFSG